MILYIICLVTNKPKMAGYYLILYYCTYNLYYKLLSIESEKELYTRLHRYSMASCQIKEQEMPYLCYGCSWKDQLRSREMYTLVSLIIAKREA